ncbi:MAG: alanine:cation symporter family protein [Alphaproteobacteria bacterium]|nr:alanine:cation symporter family protein [Alphaproteobacteria bacterium]
MDIDQTIDSIFAPVAEYSMKLVFFSVPIGPEGSQQDLSLILVWLAAAAIFLTIYLGFINFRYFGHAISLLCDRSEQKDDGQISSFQALATSLSGTVGLGNIAGVAVAVSVGGPGALFWMMVMGFLGMSTKFAEVTLGVKYRHHKDPDHPQRISGGPMYYLRDGFANRDIPFIGTFLAVLFSLCCIGGSIGGGNMFQANQAYVQMMNVTGGEEGWLGDKGWLFGIALSVLVGIVIVGGIRSISAVASKLVPVMGILYLGGGLVIIAMNYADLPGAVGTIFTEALSLSAGIGGFLGALLTGIQRASFSNEAGLGSAAIVHSAARTDPVTQGFVAMLGPFIDTVIVCMITGLVIVVTGVYEGGEGVEGVRLTSRAFESDIEGARYFLALTVLLFAYSTIITWFYCGVKAVTFLFGENDVIHMTYRVVYCALVIVGASADLENVIAFTDAMILSMAFPNILGLYFLAPEIKRDIKKYVQTLKIKEKVSAAGTA